MASDPPKPDLVHSGALAREEPCLLSVGERVAHVRDLMEQGRWRSRQSRELAALWQISEASVRRHAAEASRQIRAVMDPDAQATRVEALLDEIEDTARRKAKRDPIGTSNALIKVAVLRARMGGLIWATRRLPEGAGEGDEDADDGDDDFAFTSASTKEQDAT